ncbi:MAG: hypothetical protein R3300_07235 [Candidatus Promineifilaceae bacterium]|nr:hypothetical protein [Candidatus Promineifilaceae bacterium]
MNTVTREHVEAMHEQMEEMWSHLGVLFDRLETGHENGPGWDAPHGEDWILADVPYHLAYCNRDVVARGIELGPDYPDDQRELLQDAEQLSAWNERKFAERPPGQTPAESVTQWRASCMIIRGQLGDMNDAALDRKAWMPLLMGWATVRHLLMFGLTHDWSEFTQLRIHMGLSEPQPSPAITTAYLSSILSFYPRWLDREAAAGRHFTTVLAFNDPGVGEWTIEVADGQATVRAGAADDADLVLTQSSETYEKTLRGIQDPAEAIRSGDVRVSDPEALSLFAALFPG